MKSRIQLVYLHGTKKKVRGDDLVGLGLSNATQYNFTWQSFIEANKHLVLKFVSQRKEIYPRQIEETPPGGLSSREARCILCHLVDNGDIIITENLKLRRRKKNEEKPLRWD